MQTAILVVLGILVILVFLWLWGDVRLRHQSKVMARYLNMWHALDKIGWHPAKVEELKTWLPECERMDSLLYRRTGTKGMLAEGVRFRIEIIEKLQCDDYYHVD